MTTFGQDQSALCQHYETEKCKAPDGHVETEAPCSVPNTNLDFLPHDPIETHANPLEREFQFLKDFNFP